MLSTVDSIYFVRAVGTKLVIENYFMLKQMDNTKSCSHKNSGPGDFVLTVRQKVQLNQITY